MYKRIFIYTVLSLLFILLFREIHLYRQSQHIAWAMPWSSSPVIDTSHSPLAPSEEQTKVPPENLQAYTTSLQGAQKGAKGDKGDRGETGAKGDKGDKGDVGQQGSQGASGMPGSTGPQGPMGATGSAGLQGPQGLQGVKGDTGAIGVPGIQGPVGPQGLTGAQGIKGDKGDIGPQGPMGATGSAGLQGLQGIKGDKGDIGATGVAGLQGVKGDKGDAGEKGADGTILSKVLFEKGIWGEYTVDSLMFGVQLHDPDWDTATRSSSGMTVSDKGLSLLRGCGFGQHLWWTGDAWECSFVSTYKNVVTVPTVDSGRGTDLYIHAGSSNPAFPGESGGDLRLSSGYAQGSGSSNILLETYGPMITNEKVTGVKMALAIMGDGRVGIGTTENEGVLTVSTPIYGDSMTLRNSYGYTTGFTLRALGAGGRDWSIYSTMNNPYEGNGKFLIKDTSSDRTRFAIDEKGRVGVGTVNPTIGKLEVHGGTVCVDTDGDGVATSCIASESDGRLKSNVTQIPGALEKIMLLRGVTFDWRANDQDVLAQYPELARYAGRGRDMGLIAQEVEAVFPEAILPETVGAGKFKQLNYQSLVGPMIEAIKELNVQEKKTSSSTSAVITTVSQLHHKTNAIDATIQDQKNTIQAIKETYGSDIVLSETTIFKKAVEFLSSIVVKSSVFVSEMLRTRDLVVTRWFTLQSQDMGGYVRFTPGASRVVVVFREKLPHVPLIQMTQVGGVAFASGMRVTDVSVYGFTAERSTSSDELVAGWTAHLIENPLVFSSPGVSATPMPPSAVPSPMVPSPTSQATPLPTSISEPTTAPTPSVDQPTVTIPMSTLTVAPTMAIEMPTTPSAVIATPTNP